MLTPRQSCHRRRAGRQRSGRDRYRFPVPRRGARPCTPASVPEPRRTPGRKGCRRQSSSCGVRPSTPDTKLRVVDGSHGHKAGNTGFFVGAVQLLAGAALAAHPVALDAGIAPAAVEYHGFHHLTHGFRSFRFDHLPPAHRLCVLQNAAVRVQDIADKIRLHQPAAVHHSAHGCGHFHIGDLTALAEGAGGQLHRPHAVDGVVQTLLGSAGRSTPVGSRRPNAAK